MKSTKWYPVVGLLALIAMICSAACDPSSTPIPPPTLIPTSEPTETPNKRPSLFASPPIICRPCPTTAISTPTSTTIDPAAAPLASPGTGEPPAPGAKKFSKIPSIVQQTIDKLARGETFEPPDPLGPIVMGPCCPIDHEGRLLLEFHALGAVGSTEKADLENFDAIVESSTADLVWPEGMSAPEGYGVIIAWVHYSQVETAAALPWVAVATMVDKGRHHVGPYSSTSPLTDTVAESLSPSTSVQKIGKGVIETIEANGEAFVLIELVDPRSMSTKPIDRAEWKREIASLQDDLLSELAPSDFRLVDRYETIPGMTGWVTETGLAKLVANHNVMMTGLTGGSFQKIGYGVIEAIEANGEAFVVIALVSPPSLSASPFDLDSLREEVSRLQDEVLSSLEPPDFRLVLRYEAVPALVGSVTDAGLEKLVAHPNVVGVGLNVGGSGGG